VVIHHSYSYSSVDVRRQCSSLAVAAVGVQFWLHMEEEVVVIHHSYSYSSVDVRRQCSSLAVGAHKSSGSHILSPSSLLNVHAYAYLLPPTPPSTAFLVLPFLSLPPAVPSFSTVAWHHVFFHGGRGGKRSR